MDFLYSVSVSGRPELTAPFGFPHVRQARGNCALYVRVTGDPANPQHGLSRVAAPHPVRSMVANLPARSDSLVTATPIWHFPGHSHSRTER